MPQLTVESPPPETPEGLATSDEQASDARTQAILAIVSEVVRDVRPDRKVAAITIDASFDRDLGLDSLARTELLSRIEARFAVSLPDTVLGEVESAGDLVRVVEAAGRPVRGEPATPAMPPAQGIATGGVIVPRRAATLIEALAAHAGPQGERVHVRLYADEGEGPPLTYGELWRDASQIAAGLQARGIGRGNTVAIMLPTGLDYFRAFFGTLIAGAVAAPLYPPLRGGRLEEHLQRLIGILENSQASLLIIPAEGRAVAEAARSRIETLRHVASIEDLAAAGGRLSPPSIDTNDLALLQYTSGSTGNPKGVMLSHANLLANIRVMADALAATADDVFVSWLPLYHDMGLIGAWLGTLYVGTPLVIMSPLAFLGRPLRWLTAVSRYRGTLSGGPNFAYELCARQIAEKDLAGIDLSAWRVAFNGAEPVSPATLERFCARFAAQGFRRETMTPVYGLAENCVGLAFPPLGRGPRFESVDRERFASRGEAVPVAAEHSHARTVTACGRALPGHALRVIDLVGVELPDRREGRLQFRGPSASAGYYRNPAATSEMIDGVWRNSGDLAYLAEGEVYITGRAKDLIIRGGRNIHPSDLEEALGGTDGVIRGRIAAFGVDDPATGSERLIVVLESRKREPAALAAIRGTVNTVVSDLTGAPPDEVVLAPPNTIPHTSSGKVRRAACRELWRDGSLARPAGKSRPPRPISASRWRRLTARLARGTRRAGEYLFAGRAWLIALLVLPFAWLAAAILPHRAAWSALHWSGRTLFFLAGIPFSVRGLEHLEATPGLLVANHASLLDVIALIAALPRPVSFVAKAELRRHWLTRIPLERIRTEFVERFDRKKSLDDFRRIAGLAKNGQPFLFFPEGTFQHAPGLLAFRMGAFLAAADAGLAITPVALSGTRAAFKDDTWFPRRVAVAVTIAPAVVADAAVPPWKAAVSLRDASRAAILRHCGEPDLRDAPSPLDVAAANGDQ